MQSNTKLTKDQKQQLRDMVADHPTVRFATDYDSVVCAFALHGNVMRFAFSVKSPNEQKFRMKVGKLRAMEKLLWEGEFTILPEAHFFEMLYSIEVLETE